MKLLWRKLWGFMARIKFKREHVPLVPAMSDQVRRVAESRIALRHSKALLERVDSLEPEVASLHRSLRDLGEQNGFANLILRSLGGGA